MNHLTSWSAVLWAFCLLWYWHEHKLEGFLYINIFSFSHLSDLAVWYYSLQDNFTVNKTQMSMTELNIHCIYYDMYGEVYVYFGMMWYTRNGHFCLKLITVTWKWTLVFKMGCWLSKTLDNSFSMYWNSS